MSRLLDTLDGDNASLAAQIASIPKHIRGYGHAKKQHLVEAKDPRNLTGGGVEPSASDRPGA